MAITAGYSATGDAVIRLDTYVTELNSLRIELDRLHGTQGLSWREIARIKRFSGMTPTMLWRIAGGYEPKGDVRKMLGLPPTRVRLAADVTEEQRAALQRFAARIGHTSWSDYCQALANEKLNLEQRLKEVQMTTSCD
jgi:hypothetical protein